MSLFNRAKKALKANQATFKKAADAAQDVLEAVADDVREEAQDGLQELAKRQPH